MPESLSYMDKNQLSKWMSRDSQFELLYKLSRDGMSAQRFHELCDNKGPTVTIFYNKDNNMYGGYLSDSWGSTGDWCTDERAFLFKLYSAGKWKPQKCPYICGETHYKASNCGPLLFSLPTFNSPKEEKTSRKTYYRLNTDSFFDGKRFDMKGETTQSVANGHNNVIDLEVFLVKDKELNLPWRETPEWNIQMMQELKDYVGRYEPLQEINIQEVNILLLGQVGAGKSSFINTINSIFKGEISSRACSGSEEYSITKKFEKFRIRDPSTKKYLRFRICDTCGVKDRLSISNRELCFILDGNLPNHYTFSSLPYNSGFVENPTVGEKMHVVAFVIDSSTLEFLSKTVLSSWKMKSFVVERGIPHVVLLTNIDKMCNLEIDNVQKVFTNALIKTTVNKVARVIGIPRSHVLPVKNYEKETLLKTNINILALITLRRLLMFADDFLENQYEQEQENAKI